MRPGDVIQIKVVDHEEFTQQAKIRPDGKINYPVIGEIDIAGLTSAQLVKIMEMKLAPYINNVVVSVTIESYFSNKIYVIGDVNRSGEVQIFEPVDVIKALSMSGGLKNSKTDIIRIVRANGDIEELSLKSFFKNKSAAESERYLLYPGDTLFIPEKFTIPWAQVSTLLTLATLMINFIMLIGSISG
ncbi:MAG: polysaccharide biosynthesis/export family protein [bacterium]